MNATAKRLLGLIGAGIQPSLTPALQEQEAAAQGLRVHYQLIDLDRSSEGAQALPALVRAAATMGFAGFNVTYPCKQAVLPLLDELSPEARRIGAVNTVVREGGRWVGHNTDGSGWAFGFARSLPDAALDEVLLLGAGGAGAAIGDALLARGCARLWVADADAARAQALALHLAGQHPGAQVKASADLAHALRRADGLVHATPVGMAKSPGLPLPEALLHQRLWLSEIVYFPIETALLRAARARGLRVGDGGGMAVGQAADAFAYFHGQAANAARMEAHLRQLLAQRARAEALAAGTALAAESPTAATLA
jgi:shikimate dehydrogenase